MFVKSYISILLVMYPIFDVPTEYFHCWQTLPKFICTEIQLFFPQNLFRRLSESANLCNFTLKFGSFLGQQKSICKVPINICISTLYFVSRLFFFIFVINHFHNKYGCFIQSATITIPFVVLTSMDN